MKKLFTIAMISAAAIIAGSSCTPQSNEKMYSSLVSMVEGSYMTGNFYVVFDNGETAFVTNTSAITFKPTIDNEARAIIYYTIEEDQTKTGFDSVITISAVYGVSVDPVRDIYDHKLGEISDYKAEIDIMEGYYARNFVNLQIHFQWGATNNSEHSIALVYNSKENHEGVFQPFYEDDGYLYLELHHNSNNDPETNEYVSYVSYKVKPEQINVSLEDYVGIKILYKALDGNIRTYKIDFKK